MPSDNGYAAVTRSRKPGWYQAFLQMPNETPQKMLIVTVALCLVCSIIVSATAVLLRPVQRDNQLLDRRKNILEVVGLLEEGKSIEESFKAIEPRIVDLATGEYVTDLDINTFDQERAARDPELSVDIGREQDLAKIGTRAKYAKVYLVKGEDGQLKNIILPVHGYGLWSTLYGFLALEADADTVVGLKFYDHAETPGLGGEVDNARWRAKWPGKKIYDQGGTPRIELVKGAAPPSDADAKYQVDALAGATITSRGVTNLLWYWLGEDGFGPYLAKLTPEGRDRG
jgi:Na+-transporting NADH:ubiquinone oxidoreductase subunit C